MGDDSGPSDQIEFLTRESGSRIDEVLVFSNQAFIKRSVRATAKAGPNRFLVEVQAVNVDAESAQASVFGEGEILGAQYREIPTRAHPQAGLQQLEDRREELERQRNETLAERSIIEKQTRFLDSLVGFAETELPRRMRTRLPDVEELRGTLGFLDQEYHALAARDNQLAVALEENGKDRATCEAQLKQHRRPRVSSRKGIEVLFDSPHEQEVRIEVGYVAKDAGWDPSYKVDVNNDLSQVKLTLFARVEQKTGENWDEVRLSFSNAIPMQGTRLPEPESWVVRLPAPAPMPFAAAGGAFMSRAKCGPGGDDGDLDADVQMAADMECLEEAEAEIASAEVTESPLAFEFTLKQPITLRSGGDETLLPLFSQSLQNRFYHYTVPRAEQTAYLVCEAKPDRSLMPGRLNLHFGGRFVGSTRLEAKKAGQAMLLNLGADRAVSVRREKLTDEKNETFFNMMDRGNPDRKLQHRITLENLRDDSVRIHVIESLPVSSSDKIQIKDVEIKPDPWEKEYQGKRGVLMWELELEPGEVREIDVAFHVKHPKELAPVGL